jgi:hypothetical protein
MWTTGDRSLLSARHGRDRHDDAVVEITSATIATSAPTQNRFFRSVTLTPNQRSAPGPAIHSASSSFEQEVARLA